MTALVSVIIPTAGRPRFLPRAVESAVTGMAKHESEIIVVPNGPDQSWRQSLARFEGLPGLRVVPVAEANANVARNRGLAAATGKYVRFLDDDDYLYPEACRSQYEILEQHGADICSGNADYVDWRGRIFLHAFQPDTDDFTEATISPQRRALPVMHVFRRSILNGVSWRESQPYLQDVQWLFDVCAQAEPRWIKTSLAVGVWQHHWGVRVSRNMCVHLKQQHIARMIEETVRKLEAAGRLTAARRRAVGEGLWQCIHMAYYRNPAHWLRFARKVMASYPDARPNIGLYRIPSARGIDPILVETIMMPKRWLNHLFRSAGDRLQLRHRP